MGYTIELVCNDCKYRKVINLGRGKTKEPLKEILKCFDANINATIKQLDTAYTIMDYEYGNVIMTCTKCNVIYTNSSFIVKFNNYLDYIPNLFCKKCNTRLKNLGGLDNIRSCNCPSCGRLSLKYKNICDWD